MKKIYLLFIAVVVLLITTGCLPAKEKRLVCKQNASGVDVTFNINFKGNTIEKMDFSYDVDMSTRDQKSIDIVAKQDFCSVVKSSMKDYASAFISCNQNVENKHLVVNAELDVDRLAGNAINKETSPNAAKGELEKQSYVCNFE